LSRGVQFYVCWGTARGLSCGSPRFPPPRGNFIHTTPIFNTPLRTLFRIAFEHCPLSPDPPIPARTDSFFQYPPQTPPLTLPYLLPRVSACEGLRDQQSCALHILFRSPPRSRCSVEMPVLSHPLIRITRIGTFPNKPFLPPNTLLPMPLTFPCPSPDLQKVTLTFFFPPRPLSLLTSLESASLLMKVSLLSPSRSSYIVMRPTHRPEEKLVLSSPCLPGSSPLRPTCKKSIPKTLPQANRRSGGTMLTCNPSPRFPAFPPPLFSPPTPAFPLLYQRTSPPPLFPPYPRPHWLHRPEHSSSIPAPYFLSFPTNT